MNYTFTRETPYGKKGEVLELTKDNEWHVKDNQGITHMILSKEISLFLLELGVIENSEWKPRDGEEYFFIDSQGEPAKSNHIYFNPFLGKMRTLEETEKRRDQIKQFVTTLK